MATPPSALVGARAILSIDGKPVGVFTQVSYGITYGTNPIYILGRFNAAEIVTTDMGTVEIDCSGLRVFDRGPHVVASVPKLQDLLNNSNEVVLTITDRQNPKGAALLTVLCKPTSYSSSTSARGIYSLDVHFSGVTIADESDAGAAQEDPGAPTFG
jgi:hypothetical protein